MVKVSRTARFQGYLLSGACVFLLSAAAANATPISWAQDQNGDFNTAGNWTPAQVPSSGDDVTINQGTQATPDTVTSSQSNTINTLATGTFDTLAINNSSTFNINNGSGVGGLNGTITVGDNSTLGLGGNTVNNGAIKLNAGGNTSDLNIFGNLTLSGTGNVTLSNTFNNRIRSSNNSTLTIGSGQTIQGAGQFGIGSMGINNQGSVIANQSTQLEIRASSTGVANSGNLIADQGARLSLNGGNGGNITQTGNGTILAQSNGVVGLNNNIVIGGGTLNTLTGGVIQTDNSQNVTLSGITNQGNFVGQDNSRTFLSGTITNNGTMTLNAGGNSADFAISGPVTLTGSGTVQLTNTFNNRIFAANGTDTLTNQQTIQGSGQFGIGSIGLNNQGSVIANQGTQLEIRASSSGVTNSGSLIADQGARLSLNGGNSGNITQTGNGTILAQNNGVVGLNNNIVVSGGTLNTLTGGIIQTDNGHNVTLSGITNQGNFVGQDNTRTFLSGTITNNGTMTLNAGGNNADFAISGPVTLTGSGTVQLTDTFNNRIFAANGTDTLTNQQTIQGSGQVGIGSMGLNNQGSVIANQSNQLEIRASVSGVTNSGSLIADQGARLSLNGSNSGAITQTNTGVILAQNNGVVGLNNNVSVTGGTLRTLSGGTIQTDNGHNAALSNLTIDGNYVGQDNSNTFASGTITIKPTATLALNPGGNTTQLIVNGDNNAATTDLTLAGGGKLVLNDNGNLNARVIGNHGNDSLLNLNGNTISGAGQLGAGQLLITNQGLVDANQIRPLIVLPTQSVAGAFVNQGTLQSSNTTVGNGGLQLAGGDFNNAGGIIQAVGANSHVDLSNNVAIHGGTLQTSGGGIIQTSPGQSSTLDSVTNKGSFFNQDNAATFLQGTITNNGTMTLNAGGNVSDFRIVGPVTLTGSGILQMTNTFNNRIFATNGADTLTNQQTIQGSGQLGAGSMALINQGSVIANQSTTLEIRANNTGVSNTGMLIADQGGRLSLNGASGGTITQTGNGTILAQNNGLVSLNNGINIVGGTLNTSSGGQIQTDNGQTATLTNITNTGNFVGQDNSATFLTGTITNNGTMTLNAGGNATDLRIVGPVTLQGTGTVQLTNNFNNRIFAANGVDTLTNKETIQGAGQVGVGSMALNNQGSIIANQSAGMQLRANGGGVANSGQLIADGAGLTIDGTNGGTVTQTANGTILARNGGVVGLQNTINIVGGILTTDGNPNSRIQTNNGHVVTLNNVTNNGNYVAQDNTITFLTGGTITNNGTFTLNPGGNATDVRIEGNLTLTGNGTLVMGNNNNARVFAQNGIDVLTNDVNHTIAGGGQLGVNSMGLVNNGFLVANNPGTQLLIQPSAGGGGFTNNGTATVTAGSTMVITGNGPFNNFNAGTGTLTGGTYQVFGTSSLNGRLRFDNANIVNNAATILLDGPNSSILNNNTNGDALANFANNSGSFTVQNGRNFTTPGAFANSGLMAVGNPLGGDAATTLTFSQGLTGTGTLQINPNGNAVIQAASTVGTLNHFGIVPGSLALGANNVTVSADYNNASFGTGNAFDKRANVSGTGLILASGNVAQAITGAQVTGGTTTTPTLNLGNVHVNSSVTDTFQVANTGTTGPSLRGAIQTAVNGGNITNAALTGSGVTAQNFGPIATGQSTGNFSVTFAPTQAGALSGQAIHVANNFANVPEQTLSLTGAAFNLAQGQINGTNANPVPIDLGNFHVKDGASTTLSIANVAPGGAFTEKLNASVGGTTGDVTTNNGSVSLLAAGAAPSTAITAQLNTNSAGAKSGTATINFVSDGTGTSGLGQTMVGSQSVQVTGKVFNLAQANTIQGLNFGLVHVNDVVAAKAFTVQNVAPVGAFTEGLDASLGAASGTNASFLTIGSGKIVNLAGGGTDSTTLTVGLDTSHAGNVNATVHVNLASNGTNSGLANTALPGQDPSVLAQVASGTVVRFANPQINNAPVQVGNVRLNTTSPQVAVSITNNVPNDGFSESLIGIANGTSNSQVTAAGAFGQGTANPPSLAPLGTDNTHILVGIDTTSAGAKSGNAIINFKSDGTAFQNGTITDLGNTNVAVQGAVFRLANPTVNNAQPLTFVGRVGDTIAQQALSITNSSPDTFTEGLNAKFAAATPSPFTTNGGQITNLAAQGTDNTSLKVGVSSLNSGAFNNSIGLKFQSNGTITNNSNFDLADGAVGVSAKIYQTAVAQVTPDPVNFGIVHVKDMVAAKNLSVANVAAGGLNDVLTGGFGTVSGPFSGIGSLGTGGVAVGNPDSTSLKVGLNTTTAGVFNGTANFNFKSHDADLADVAALGQSSVGLTAQVNNFAKLAFAPNQGGLGGSGVTFTLDFGQIAKGQTLKALIGYLNLGGDPNFTDALDALLTGTSNTVFGLSGATSVSGLAGNAQSTDNLDVALDTTGLGLGEQTELLTFDVHSINPDSDTDLGPVTLLLEADVVTAVSTVPEPGTLAAFGAGLGGLLFWRRRKRQAA